MIKPTSHSASRRFELRHTDTFCELVPDVGGAITCWQIAGQNMLRRATDFSVDTSDVLGLSTFPLVPYSNRIGYGTFDWGGETITLAHNFPPEPHAIHGVGWKIAWDVAHRTANMAILTYTHVPDASWPWAFTAEQHIELGPLSLSIRLRARNDAKQPVPLGFGHHPYFDQAGACLKFRAEALWMNGADMLPTVLVDPDADYDFAELSSVERRSIDNCYTAWDGAARIEWLRRPYALNLSASSSLPVVVIYVPLCGDAFCVEPVPHATNAINMSESYGQMPVIEPGLWFEADILFAAEQMPL